MRRRLLLGGVLVLALVGVSDPAAAQPAKKDDKVPAKPGPGDAALNEGYRRFFKRPETVAEAWDAMKFEMEVGRYDLAGLHLRTLLSKNPTDEQLLALEEKEGTPAFLRLLNVPPESWGPDPAYQKECRDNAAKLVNLVSDALAKRLKDGKRMAQLVEALNKSPEEKEYALKELLRYRAAAVPPIIDALRTAKAGDRYPLLQALELLGPDVVPPMLAALDSGDAILQLELLDVLKKRAAKEAVPHLWYLIDSPASAESVRRRAAEVQGYLTEMPPSALPSRVQMLVREAEKYYKHEVKFPDPRNVRVWRWDGKGVVLGWPGEEAVPATKAEEYWGMKFAGQAMRLDSSSEPAQALLLSLILDKAMEQAGVEQPLARGVPGAHDLLATVNPDLISLVLERGLREQQTPVVLAAVRALGDVADVRAARDTARGPSALHKALFYPDARVQFAAAESLVRIPADPGPVAAGRVVEILGRALAGSPEVGRANTRVIVASASDPWKAEVGRNLTAAGFEPVPVASGRELMRRVTAAADVGGIVAATASWANGV